MRLRETFVTHDSDGIQVMVDTGLDFSGIVRSNRTAAEIVNCLKKDTTRDAVVKELLFRYDAPESVVSADVDMVIGKLKQIGALVE